MSQFKFALGVIFFAKCVSGLIFNNGSEFEFIVHEFNKHVAAFDSSKIKTNWLEQPLDHFDPHDNRTWKMRYFERYDLWKEDKPIYLFLEGAGEATPSFLKTGILYDLARETNGALFLAEHRYYGKSKPFEDFTPETLRFLSSRQALADFASLLKYIKSSSKFKSSKVVVVGGSYAGNLAAWMKLIYPDLVDAAIASSPPVLAQVDFYEYLETVSDNFEQYGSLGCWDKINEQFSSFKKAFETKEGTEVLKREEHICESTDMSKKLNQELFFLHKASSFMDRSQYAINVSEFQEFCASNFTSKFERMKKPLTNWKPKSDCYSYDFDEAMEELKTSTGSYTAWIYQTCTEFGYYQTGSSDKQPFTRSISLDFYFEMCSKIFGPDFDEARVRKGVDETNTRYEGLKPNVTHVVFVNGDLDPWSKLSVLEDLSYEAPAKKIGQSSHCRDLFSDRDGDSGELKEARRYIKYLIKKWIGEGEYYIKL